MGVSILWKAPKVNPVNKKALSVPIFNPFDKYGRTFFFSTFGFMIAFLSWYAFPPLLTKSIKEDLHLSQAEIGNSNIMALVATLIMRLIVGPLCDRYGPRYVFAGVLLAGSIPTALAGTVTDARGLLIIRFFVGILGATFVPCQVWSTGFYDKSVVGTANALMAGLGNAGGGITYFVMPAIFDSFVKNQGLTPRVSWRVSFIVPFILITATALGMLLFCEDTPTGPWSERHLHAQGASNPSSNEGTIVDTTGNITDHLPVSSSTSGKSSFVDKDDLEAASTRSKQHELTAARIERIAESEVIHAPTFKESLGVMFSLQALLLSAPYACSFGGELAINSILGAYYSKNFPHLGQTKSGQWAAMFGLLNVFFHIIYRATKGSVAAKKFWLLFLGVAMGGMCLCIGLLNPHDHATMIGLIACMAFFMDGANGANFAVVPHVFPSANGILSGVVGAAGNLGGVIFAIIFRYNGNQYGRSIWISGIIMIAVNLSVSWIRPIPKSQIAQLA
ncbi:major facilitator superfamily domain-containing protein [Pyronema domesticum]|uniref:Nitrate/nitrite transporter n=1 Tax=Pyronema omphalodes (strain CBS 100304) TaxID=1076935 RepID=U4LCS0_PYROM|nr:major facilitator superfamily domain-containing protein [Pyronema domesticum]CCX12218.1 Similar to Nitrate transporter; acc. no. P22152 [Pyronema omphalodes CBS 100304]